MTKVGEILPAMLAARGVKTVFGIPGVHTIEMYRGLAKSPLRHVTPRHEQGAGFMAEGYWRAAGRIPAVFTITGPGLTNVATPMAQALAGSAPMLVISSVNDRAHMGRRQGRLHEMPDQSGLASHIALWSETAETPDQIAALLDRAFADFGTKRPGPVHIQIPKDALSDDAAHFTDQPALVPAPPAADAQSVVQAVEALNAAGDVALILGGGAVGMGRARAVRLAETLGAPTLLTSFARGLLPADHPLNIGGMLDTAEAQALLRDASAVLAIGTEFGETDWDFYYAGEQTIGGTLIRADICAEQTMRNQPADIALAGDATLIADALLEQLIPQEATQTAHIPIAQDRYTRHAPLIETIWKVAPDAILVGDSTEPSYCAGLCARPPGPQSWWSGAPGFGTLGYALPAAIGAQVAAPDRPVIALAGDGGALYTIAELASAVEAQANIVLIVWNNDGYGEIRTFMEEAQVKPEGVDLSPVHFSALAQGFGAGYASAEDISEVGDILSKPRTGPLVLELREDRWRW